MSGEESGGDVRVEALVMVVDGSFDGGAGVRVVENFIFGVVLDIVVALAAVVSGVDEIAEELF